MSGAAPASGAAVVVVRDLRKAYGETKAVDGTWVCVVVLLGFLGVCFAISARFFRWQ